MAPSSRLAASSNPNVAYLESNFPALLKKQTTLPSLAYAGIPYQVFGQRSGAVASTISWSRLAMTRSDPSLPATAASRSRSPSARFLLARASAFSSWARAFIAARSSAVNPLDVVLRALALFADFCVTFVAGFFSAISKHPFQEEESAQRDDAQSHRRRRSARSRSTPTHVSLSTPQSRPLRTITAPASGATYTYCPRFPSAEKRPRRST